MSQKIVFCLSFAGSMAATALHAQGIATERQLESITVVGVRERTAEAAPSVSASKTAADLRLQNLVNPEDALRYAPNLTIRKRYIGDRNALIGGRSFSTLQAPRGLVFMDGYLISNFLGRFDAPRWNMIAPEEIERVDVLYGPFSALYPGNSIGTTVAVTTRRPDGFELGARTTGFTQSYEEYGFEDDYSGHQLSGFLGNRFDNGAWTSLAVNRQDSTSHPMQYYAVSANAAGSWPAVSGPPTPVTGVSFDRDPQGFQRAVFGANSGAIDHTIQNQMKLRAGFAWGDWLEIEGFVAGWDNDTDNENRSFMTDAAGNRVWAGRVMAEGIAFTVPDERRDNRTGHWLPAALSPSTREEQHLSWGATLRSTRAEGWNGSVVYSQYEIQDDLTRQALRTDPLAAHGGRGTLTARDGTGWDTFEMQAVYTPYEGDWTGGEHTLALGYHHNSYELRNPTWVTDDWRGAAGALQAGVDGRTRLEAWYAQDIWQFGEHWSATLGLRYEAWSAFDGSQYTSTCAPVSTASVDCAVTPAQTLQYPQRSEYATSPKLSMAWQPDAHWLLRLSVGRGVRFPTVAELFQGTQSGNSITVNDPNLQPERSDAIDLTTEYRADAGSVRVSLFQDDVEDTIWTQTNITVFPNVTNVQNIDRVRTRGVELAFQRQRFGWDSLSLDGSIAYARAKIMENDNNPATEGNLWPRVPDWRGNLLIAWRPIEPLTASLGLRYSGRMYNRLENDDINPDTYGGVSSVKQIDACVAWQFAGGVEVAAGVDNFTDQRAWQSHPYPGRTALLELRWSHGP